MDNFFSLMESTNQIEEQYKLFKRHLKRMDGMDEAFLAQILDRMAFWGQSGYRHLQIQAYEALYQKFPSSVLAFLLGYSYSAVSQYDRAYQWLDKVDKQDLDLEGRLLLADVNLKLGHLNEARKELQAIINDHPRDYRAYHQMSEFYRMQAINEKAIYYLETLMEYFISEDDSLRRQWRTDLLALYLSSERIDTEKISALFDQDNEDLTIETADECYLLAHFYAQINNFNRSNHFCELGLQIDPDHFELRLLQLENLTYLQETSRFANQLDQLLKSLPPYDGVVMDCLRLADRMGVFTAKLIQLLEDYYPLLDNAEDQFLVLSAYVAYYLDQKDYQQANLFMEKFDLQAIDESLLAYLKGKILFHQGQKEQAKAYLDLAWDQQVLAKDLPDMIQQLSNL
ncbi:tetratricopeptide repeat protein [Facklamia sp. P9177]|uniref:tetratricopeptide repeat protein n=1 Tax=Facklamia sp. P9177 TaxID=3421945 RepID=UPI003D16F0E1